MKRRSSFAGAGRGLLLACAMAATLGGVPRAESPRFRPEHDLPGSADWVVSDGRRVARGSGLSIEIADRGVPLSDVATPAAPAVSAALIGRRVYLALEDGSISVVETGRPQAPAARFVLDPPPRGRLHLARSDQLLLVAEDGAGLRVLLPSGGHEHHSGAVSRLEPLASFALQDTITAITAAGASAFVGTADGRLLEIDLREPQAPGLSRVTEIGVAPLALAANGSVIYLLGADGMRVLSRLDPAAASAVAPEVRGRALAIAGRTLWVGDGPHGAHVYRDRTPQGLTHPVTVANDFFLPEELTVEVGDTVRWSNLSGFHNVFSCVPSQIGCDGVAANESFTSGPPAFPVWTLDHTFVAEGFNPYICQSHAPTMTGLVIAGSPTLPPPAVPDGRNGGPLLVGKQNTEGSNLRVWWDGASCSGAGGHHLLYGVGSQLPGTLGGEYRLAGSRCAIGTSPFTWLGTPPADRDESGLIWWLVVADDGESAEGSWGADSAGAERQNAYPGGASRRCGFGVKDLTNPCGQ